MQNVHTVRARRLLFVLAPLFALGAPLAAKDGAAPGGVILIEPVETVVQASLPSMLAGKFARLASIDPRNPLADDGDRQTLSLFGREDLIAAVSDDYRPGRCFPATGVAGVFEEIETRARATSIVIVNESHERSQHRGFTAEVARRLRPLGYDVLAMETLMNDPPGLAEDKRSTFLKQPTLPYLADEDGYYLSEAGFGRLGRQAKALGYRLFPYEPNEDGPAVERTWEQRIALREEGQASALAAFLRDHPGTKLLMHVGYSHAAEVPRGDGSRWMAVRLKQKTGIDPLTVSQISCRGSGKSVGLSALPADEPKGSFDLIVDHPDARFERGRPEWRKQAGDSVVSIPYLLRPTTGWRVVEARPVGESTASVPMDRVAIRPGEDVALMLPPGRYALRIIDPVAVAKTPVNTAH